MPGTNIPPRAGGCHLVQSPRLNYRWQLGVDLRKTARESVDLGLLLVESLPGVDRFSHIAGFSIQGTFSRDFIPLGELSQFKTQLRQALLQALVGPIVASGASDVALRNDSVTRWPSGNGTCGAVGFHEDCGHWPVLVAFSSAFVWLTLASIPESWAAIVHCFFRGGETVTSDIFSQNVQENHSGTLRCCATCAIDNGFTKPVVSALTPVVTAVMASSLGVTWVTDAARAMCSITGEGATKSITGGGVV